MARRTRAAAARHDDPELAARIIDAAVELGEEIGWADVRLHQVADRLGVSLVDVSACFRDLDAVANAWFARGRDAALAAAEAPGFADEPARHRLFLVMMRWFDSFGEHRGVTRQMIAEKVFYPSHPHHWVPAIFELSRLMHWFLDAARIRGTGRMRQMEEIGLTTIFLGALAVWSRDDTPALERTRRFLRNRLDRADRLMARIWGGRRAARGRERPPAAGSDDAAGGASPGGRADDGSAASSRRRGHPA